MLVCYTAGGLCLQANEKFNIFTYLFNIIFRIFLQFTLIPLDGGVAVHNLGLESLLIIQVFCCPSCQFGNALQESPASSGTKAQAKASTEVMQYIHYHLF